MLVRMDVPAATWLWILAAVALVVLLLALAALLSRAFVHKSTAPLCTRAREGSRGRGRRVRRGRPAGVPRATARLGGRGRGVHRLDRAGLGARTADDRRNARRAPRPAHRRRPLIVVAAVAALVLVAAAIAARGDAGAAIRPRGDAGSATSVDGRRGDRTPWTPTPGTRACPTVPAAPSPGDPGAGALAGQSVPLGRDGLAADLRFGGVVLERRAVGVTVTYPRVRLTTDGARPWRRSSCPPTTACPMPPPPIRSPPGAAGPWPSTPS